MKIKKAQLRELKDEKTTLIFKIIAGNITTKERERLVELTTILAEYEESIPKKR